MNRNFSPRLKPYLKKLEYSYTFGTYPTLDMLKLQGDHALKVLFSSSGQDSDGIAEIRQLAEEIGIPTEVNDHAIEKIAFKENTYTIGIFQKYDSELTRSANHLVLGEPRNMGNLGTIIRTMVGFGMKDLAIIRPAADIFDPKVVRSAMGALFSINFKYFDSYEEYITDYEGERFFYPFMLNGGADIREVLINEPYSIIMGNESTGLPESFQQTGTPIYIPQSSEVDSLNLSIATAIALWHFSTRKS